ncbi:hypothetical protein [Streptomyces phaeofaciens]|uniref:hypothetical protein n=1 Tax=Streptomyces phaeofaciens TaxID=68254 RepID=UPI003691A3DF
MGIESDQVVYEYLSRVGDVAQQRQLSSATRMRLVSELRNEIDRRRARTPVDSPAAVRRILERLGEPDDVVAAASDDGTGAPREQPAPAVPVQRDSGSPDGEPARPKGFWRAVPRPRPGTPSPAPSDLPGPRRGGADAPGDGVRPPDWWRGEPDSFVVDDEVPGFVGGVEIPELLERPRPKEPEPGPAQSAEAETAGDEDAPAGRRGLPRLFRSGTGWNNPLLLLAAASLVAGAVLGNWFALVLGWLIAYASHRLTERETKFAVVWLPGLAAAAGIVWLWGRSVGRWGDPIAEGRMSVALAETWPWVVKGAAVATALFLVWRSRRQT